MSKTTGNLFVVSAPSGAGKTSLMRALEKRLNAAAPTVTFSVSTTTRAPRSGEVDGQDYHFVDQERFVALREQGAFLESAQVFDHYYGTSQASVEASLKNGLDVILEIDWQGASHVREATDCVSIFILPPSKTELEARLRGRGQDSEAIIARRMRDAESEMSHWQEFDYIVVNDDFETALDQLISVFQSQRLTQAKQAQTHRNLIESLLS